jgi:hypothetical protein
MVDEMISPPESIKEDGEWAKFVKGVVRVCVIRARYSINLTELVNLMCRQQITR